MIDFLFILVILFVLAITITAVYHIFLRVPYVPTPKRVVAVMVEMAQLRDGEVVYDLGAGDGRLLIAAKHACPGITARGCELVPTIWLWGKLRCSLAGEDVDLKVRSIFAEDVHDADVIFLYLFPGLMQKLQEKFERELRPGTRVISHAFRFPGKVPQEEVKVPWGRGSKTVRMYQW